MLRNVMIDTSVGPLVGVTNGNGVVYVNGTPHALAIYSYDKVTIPCVIPPSGTVVRVPDEYQPLPEMIPGMYIIVSRVAAEALKIYHRPDIRVPGDPVRNQSGIQIGAVGISHYA